MPETHKVVTIERLSAEQLRKLRRMIGGSASLRVSDNTTQHQAGWQLGVNYVLALLEEGFTLAAPQSP